MPNLNSKSYSGWSKGHSLDSAIYDLYCAKVRVDKLIHPLKKQNKKAQAYNTVNESNATQIVRMGGWTQPQHVGPRLPWTASSEPMQARAALGREAPSPVVLLNRAAPGTTQQHTRNPVSSPLLHGSARLYHRFRKPGEAGQAPTNNSLQGNPPLLPTRKRPAAEAAFQGNRRAQRIIV